MALNCGGAMGIRTPDLLHAMGNAAVHLPPDASQRRPVMLNTARTTFRTTVRSRSKDLETTTDHMITSYPARKCHDRRQSCSDHRAQQKTEHPSICTHADRRLCA